MIVGQVNCAAGRWSNASALGVPCSWLCDAGYICSGASVYCPQGSAAAVAVSAGFYSAGGTSTYTQTMQLVCPSPSDPASNGSAVYCTGDGLIQVCPGGKFGNASGLTSSACSGPCLAGYYCPAGSANSTAFPCGGKNVYVVACHCVALSDGLLFPDDYCLQYSPLILSAVVLVIDASLFLS